MTLLFVLMAASILLGSVFLWVSGHMVGSAGAVSSAAAPAVDSKVLEELQRENRELEKQIQDALLERDTEPGDHRVDNTEEVAQLSSELAKVEGEKERAAMEIDNLKDEIESLKLEVAAGPKGAPQELPPSPPVGGDEAMKKLQDALNDEKVAHQKTKDELVQIKKIAAVKMASSPTFNTAGTRSGGSKFQTMAFTPKTPGGGGGASEILKGALDKVQSEKDKLQSELDRAKKEIQLLKMRG